MSPNRSTNRTQLVRYTIAQCVQDCVHTNAEYAMKAETRTISYTAWRNRFSQWMDVICPRNLRKRFTHWLFSSSFFPPIFIVRFFYCGRLNWSNLILDARRSKIKIVKWLHAVFSVSKWLPTFGVDLLICPIVNDIINLSYYWEKSFSGHEKRSLWITW